MKLFLSTILLWLFYCPSVAALYQDPDDVEVLTDSNFEQKVIQNPGVSLVQFYAPWCGHCQQFATVYKQIANILKGIVFVGAVDATVNERIASQWGVTGYPTLKVFADGEAKDVKTRDPSLIVNDYVFPSLQDLIAGRIGKGARSSRSSSGHGSPPQESKVLQLNAANFEKEVYQTKAVVGVAFVAPWCGHCKQLLPEWEEAARILDGTGAVLGVVDATVETTLAQQFGVEGYPTIKVWAGGDKRDSSLGTRYLGGRQSSQIAQYMLEEVDRSGVPKEIPELTSKDTLNENCNKKGKICVLVALPHILETGAEGRNKYKDIVTAASKAVRGMSFEFMWFEGGSFQLDLENAFELTFGYPAVAAYSVDKGVYAVHRSSFTEANIKKFLLGITTGKQSTYKISKQPKIETTEPWDGQDGVPFEEEPLDNIMSWDDDDDDDEEKKDEL